MVEANSLSGIYEMVVKMNLIQLKKIQELIISKIKKLDKKRLSVSLIGRNHNPQLMKQFQSG